MVIDIRNLVYLKTQGVSPELNRVVSSQLNTLIKKTAFDYFHVLEQSVPSIKTH